MAYAPGVQSRVGDYFASVGPQVGQNLRTYLQNREERQQAQSAAETMVPLLDEKGHELFGEKLMQIPTMSTGQAKGVLGGLSMYLSNQYRTQQGETERQLHQAQIAELQRKTDQEKAEDEATKRFNDALNNRENPDAPLTLDQFVGIAGKAGVLGPKTLPSLVREIGYTQVKGVKNNKIPLETTIGGRTVAYSPDTGAFQVLPDKLTAGDQNLVELKTPDGKVYGYAVRTPKGGLQPVTPARATATGLKPNERIRAGKELQDVSNKLVNELIRNQDLEAGSTEKIRSNQTIKNMRKQRESLESLLKGATSGEGGGSGGAGGAASGATPVGTDGGEMDSVDDGESDSDDDEQIQDMGAGDESPAPRATPGGTGAPAAAAAAPAAPKSDRPGKVLMVRPDGATGYIDSADYEEALKQGFKPAK